MDPDVAILPEVENVAILDEINTKQLGGAYKTAVPLTNDFRGLDIGILSKVPIDKIVSHTEDSFERLDLAGGKTYTYSRDAVEVHLTVGSRQVILLGVHYRSKGDGNVETDDKDKRAAEAQHTREIADNLAKADPSAAIVILGDFNDLPGSDAVKWTLAGDPKQAKVTFSASARLHPSDGQVLVRLQEQEGLIDHQMSIRCSKLLDPASVSSATTKDVEDAATTTR
jgi:hypothetical protein